MISFAMTLDSGPESPAELIGFPLGYIISATAAYGVVVFIATDTKARLFTKHRWISPSLCGILLSVFTFTGLVENSTDIVGQVIGHQYERAMLVGSVVFWTIIATGIMIGVDRLISINHNKPLQSDTAARRC